MKTKLLLLFCFLSSTILLQAQDIYMTRSGEITFFSTTPFEDIEAENNTVTCIIKPSEGKVAIKVLMKSFQFEKAAMQQHFNDDYVESDKFPNAKYDGAIIDAGKIDWSVDGVHKVVTQGELTIHGVTQSIEKDGTITIKGKDISIETTFNIELSDYDINVPSNYLKKINNSIEIKVNATLQPYVR